MALGGPGVAPIIGQSHAPPPVCLLAHYNPRGRIGRPLLHYIGALAAAGYRVVLACSGQTPPECDLAAAREAGADEIMCRPNGGLDFGAWRDLMQAGHIDGAPGVLLTNDSVYGPLWDLSAAIRRFLRQSEFQLDAWGMVESRQGVRHLQSWFVHIDAALLASPAVRRVFDQPFESMGKQEIIVRGELALSAALQAEGARYAALYGPAQATRLGRIAPGNPMHLDWRSMITKRRLPFVKAELLRTNPMAIPWLEDWPRVVAGHSTMPVAWIHDDLHAYSGQSLFASGTPFKTPAGHLAWRLHAFYAALSRDHGAGLRSLGRRLLRGG